MPTESVFPLVLGVDGAGRVTETGEGVTRFRPGDMVHGQLLRAPPGSGTFAEYTAITESRRHRAPHRGEHDTADRRSGRLARDRAEQRGNP